MSFFLFNLIEGVGEFVFNTIDLIKNWIDPKTQPKEGLKLQRKGSNLPIKLVYGTRTVGADIVDENTTDGSGGIKNEFYHVLAEFCYGEVEEIEEVFFNGVSWNDARWSKEGGGKWFTYELRKGGTDNLTPMGGSGKFNRWSDTTSLYEGLCVGIFTFEQAQDENIWQGEPQITARIKGKKCYDWRTGETIYTENPVVHLIDYVKSDAYGLDLSDSLIDYTNATIVANFCGTGHTAAVTKRVCEYDPVLKDYYCVTNIEETATFARFSHNNIIDTGEQVFDNVKEIATSFRGFFPDNNGLFSVATESEADSVFSFDDDNIIGAITTKTTSKNDKYNQVTVRFPNIENNFEMDEVIYPETDSATYTTWLAEDNGVLLDHSITSETCVYKAEALQLAEVAAKVSRNNDQIGFTATALAMELDVGDVIDITNNTRGWVNKEFRIDSITENDDYTVTIAATLHNDTVYPWVDQTYNEYIGGSYLGNPNVIDAPAGLAITSDTTLATTGLLTWSHASNAFTRGYLVKAIVGGTEVLSQPCDTKSFTIPLLASGAYTFEVYARNTLGKTSTAGTLLATLAAPTTPTDLELIVSDWDISAKPILSGAGLGTVFDFDYVEGDGTSYTPTPKAQGYDVAITGLLPDTQYTIYTRAVNAFGTSAWYSESTTTTNTGEQISIFIDPIQAEIDAAQSTIDGLESDVDVINTNIVNTNFKLDESIFRLQTETVSRETSDAALLSSIAKTAATRQELIRRINEDELLINAVVEVDPLNGSIVNKAFAYSDDQFTQAQVEIDGVDARVTTTVESVSLLQDQVNTNTAELELVPGQITAIATSITAEAIAALEPAYAFNFFDSAQGWSAVNGTLTTPTSDQINVTWWDIESNSLSFVAEDNPLIRVTVERTGGTGWVGDLIIERDDLSTHTFSGIISDIPTGGDIVRSIDLRGNEDWTGTITSVRLVGGATVADTFEIKSIVIGKPDAYALELDDLTARVTTAELDIDANEAAITQRVTVTDYNDNTVTFSNVETTVDGLNSVIELQAARQELIDDDTIAKANSATVTIDGYTGTITSLAQTVVDNKDDADDNFTVAFEEIDSTNGRITNQIFSISQNANNAESSLASLLRSEALRGQYLAGQISENAFLATAIDEIRIDISDDGAVGEAIRELEVATNNNGSLITANSSAIQQVEIDTEGNASAISAIDARVTEGEEFASAQLTLNSEFDSQLGTLTARAFLGTDVSGRVTGINIESNPSVSVISFIGDKVEFLRPTDNSVAFQWVDTDDTFVFDGKIIATDSTFTGTITGTTINGGTVTGTTITGGTVTGTIIKSETTGQRVEIEGTTQKFFPATGTDYVSLDGEKISIDGSNYDFVSINPSSGVGGLNIFDGTSELSLAIRNSTSFGILAYFGGVYGSSIDLSNTTARIGTGFHFIEANNTVNRAYIYSQNRVQILSDGTYDLTADGDITITSNSDLSTEYVDISKNGDKGVRLSQATNGASPTLVTLYYNNLPKLITTSSGITVEGSVFETSDPSIKNFHRKLDGKESLQKVMDLDLWEYEFKDAEKYGDRLQVGVNAETAGEIFDGAASESEDGTLSFNYKHAYIHGLAAIKQLKSEFDEVKAELNELKQLIKGLK